MVLICNNNVLTIEKFHENRRREKNEMKQIICDRKYNKNKEDDAPKEEKECNSSYSQSIDMTTTTSTNSKQLSSYNCHRK
jgi:hypothetical protein